MKWPKNDKPDDYARLNAGLRQAFDHFQSGSSKPFAWTGLPTGEGHIKPPPEERVRKLEKGRDYIDLLFEIAIDIGIEQGRRIERKKWADIADIVRGYSGE